MVWFERYLGKNKSASPIFDSTIVTFDEAEIWKLVDLSLLDKLFIVLH